MPNLNLIPPQLKTEYQRSIVLSRWFRSAITLMIFTTIGAGLGIGGLIRLNRHAREIKQELTAAELQQKRNAATDITATTNTLNSTINSVSGILRDSRSWARDTAVVLSILSPNITVTNLTIQTGGMFRLTGTADTRSSFLELDAALKQSLLLTQVITKSTASKRTAVPFDYSGQINLIAPLP